MISSPIDRKNGFREFLMKRNPSPKFVKTYFVYLRSTVVKKALLKYTNCSDIFMVTDDNPLQAVYDAVKGDPDNIRLHNIYSGAVNAYRKFLCGKNLRAIIRKQQSDSQ